MILLTCGLAKAEVDTKKNQVGRLTSVGNGVTRTFYQYDAQGRSEATQYVQDNQSRTFVTSYGYPHNPQTTEGQGVVVLTQAFPDGEQVAYTYDLTGLQVGVRSKLGAAIEDIVRDVRRNARGQITKVELGNNVVTTFEYDETGHLQLIRSRSVNGSNQPVQDYVYAYDKNGNVIETTDGIRGDQSATYEYDSLDQLILFKDANPPNSVIEAYDYDEIGNLTKKGALTQSYNAGGRPHALADSAGVVYGYDANGNVTSIGAATNIEWNAENMATKVTAGPVVTEKSFVGESLWKKVEKGVTTYYLPSMRIENGVARKYYGSSAERLEQGDRQVRFYHPDHLGSSSVMTDQSGTVIRRASYFPWGQDRGVDGTFTPKLQFNFKEKDESGFYDYGARLYSPLTGRWLSPDNTLADGLNRYSYARNNPWSRVDPTGHQSRGIWVTCRTCEKVGDYVFWWEGDLKDLPDSWTPVVMWSECGCFKFKDWAKEGKETRIYPDGSAEVEIARGVFSDESVRAATRQELVAIAKQYSPDNEQGSLYAGPLVREVGRRVDSAPFKALEYVAHAELMLFTTPATGASLLLRAPTRTLNIVEGVGLTGSQAATKAIVLGSNANTARAVAEGGGAVARFTVKNWSWQRNVEFLKWAAESGIPIVVHAGGPITRREINWLIKHGVKFTFHMF